MAVWRGRRAILENLDILAFLEFLDILEFLENLEYLELENLDFQRLQKIWRLPPAKKLGLRPRGHSP